MEINKNSPESGTCYNKNYDNFFIGINYQIKDTFFFAFILQFILVSLMYYFVGNGKYWKVLHYTSIAGLVAAVLEHSTLAYICQKSQINNNGKVYSFFISELFWIINEYAVPVLNVIKIETLSTGRIAKTVKYIVIILLLPFSIARLYNGYDRMMNGYLNIPNSNICHGIAFGILGISDTICSLFIILYSRYRYDHSLLRNSKITHLMKNSGYTILLIVDFVSIVLSVLYIISTIYPNNTNISSSTTLFHCIKSVFILILSTDALLFKYGAAGSSSSVEVITSTVKTQSYKYDYLKSINDTSITNYGSFNNINNNSNSDNNIK